MTLVAIGAVAGLVGAFWVTNLLRTLLFGVNSRDPFVYAAVYFGVAGVGLLANFAPCPTRIEGPILCGALRFE